MAVKIQVKLFRVVMPYSVVVGCHCFRGLCCLHLQGEFMMSTSRRILRLLNESDHLAM